LGTPLTRTGATKERRAYLLCSTRNSLNSPNMSALGRPGPKPKRLYARVVRWGDADRDDLPKPREIRDLNRKLERAARLVAHGALTHPPGDLLIFRAQDLGEAERIARADPFRSLSGVAYELIEWNPSEYGSGVNLDPPPAIGAGRLTQLQRVSIVVRDQEKAIQWYRDVLGFSVRSQDDETGYVEMALGKGTAAISLVAPRREWGEPTYSESMARVGTATGIAFQTDSVRALELRLRNAGARVTQPPSAQPWGGVTLRFVDPDGNEFLAFQPEDEAGVAPVRRPSGHGLARPVSRRRSLDVRKSK
jgi:catechol 2,3-dioxygenase-like lactoylglutathione lyase family enzyme